MSKAIHTVEHNNARNFSKIKARLLPIKCQYKTGSSGGDIHAHLGKLGIARNIIDGIGMDLKEMMEKKT